MFTNDASKNACWIMILISPWKWPWRGHKQAGTRVKTKYRSGISQAQGYLPRGYVSLMKTMDPEYLARKQLFKNYWKVLLVFVFASNFVSLDCRACASACHASLVKTRLIFVTLMRLPVLASLVRIGLERLAWNIRAKTNHAYIHLTFPRCIYLIQKK